MRLNSAQRFPEQDCYTLGEELLLTNFLRSRKHVSVLVIIILADMVKPLYEQVYAIVLLKCFSNPGRVTLCILGNQSFSVGNYRGHVQIVLNMK